MINIKIKQLHPDFKLPKKANLTDAGFDLVSISKTETDYYIEYGLGFSTEIPEGWCGLIFPRSSISKYDIMLCNSIGIVDSGYRNEWLCRFNKVSRNSPYNPFPLKGKEYEIGDKIAQVIFYKLPDIEFSLVDELNNNNNRGGGFGSTDK